MNDIIMRKLCAKNLPEYAFIRPPEIPKRKWHWKGTIEISKFEFKKALEKFVFHTIFTRPEAIIASCLAQFECLEARDKFLLHFPITKAVRIEEFEQVQLQTIQQSSSYLKVSYQFPFTISKNRPIGLRTFDAKFE